MEIHEVPMQAGRVLEAGEGSSSTARNDSDTSASVTSANPSASVISTNPSASVSSARASLQIETTQDPATTVSRRSPDDLWKVIFLLHLLILFIVATLFGFYAPDSKSYFIRWYLPLVSSYGISFIVAYAWLFTSLKRPRIALRASFYFGPFMTLAVGIYFFTCGTDWFSIGTGLAVFLAAIFLSIYAYWARHRFYHANQILTASLLVLQLSRELLNSVITIHSLALLYCLFWTQCVGGIVTVRPRYSAIYISILLLSLAWTMQVIRNTVHVLIARMAHIEVRRPMVYPQRPDVLREAFDNFLGSVSLGSALVPVIVVLRSISRSLLQMLGGCNRVGPFFSCRTRCREIGDRLMGLGNRWGFVLVASENGGFVEASGKAWEMFKRQGMERVIDSDLTSSFCFMSGVAGAGMSAICATLIARNINAVGLAAYALIVGYYIGRIAMAWPQACVSAYHVAYAENPQGDRFFDLILLNRIHELM